jgi:hydrogenase maturation factor
VSFTPERCITCSDEAVEAEVLAVHGLTAVVRVGSGEESVAIDLVPGAAPGDRLLCHAGIALDILPQPDDGPQVAQSHKVVSGRPAGVGGTVVADGTVSEPRR